MRIHAHLVQKNPGESKVEIDGVDFTPYVLADGFFVDATGPGQFTVTMSLVPDCVEITGDVRAVMERAVGELDDTAADVS